MAIKGKDNRLVTNRDYNDGRISRTLVDRPFVWRSTFNSGYLLPLWCDECYPGEIKTVDFGTLLRSITPLGPTMDDSFLDVYFFFVPNRLVWDHWEEFIAGYNKTAWTQGTTYQVPQILFQVPDSLDSSSTKNMFTHSWLDYCPGLCDVQSLFTMLKYYSDHISDVNPPSLDSINDVYSFSALYPRSYALIWNQYFRDENLQDELDIYTGDNDQYATNADFCFDLMNPTDLPKAGKLKNRFTTAWPQPQKGPDVLIPMNNLALSGNLPVGFVANANETTTGTSYAVLPSGTLLEKDKFQNVFQGTVSGSPSLVANSSNILANNVSNTIRQLRVAVQTEKFLYRDAKGTKYNESLISHWGQHSTQARLDMPEYLGSKQIPISVVQVTNTAAGSSALGAVGGQSVTKDYDRYFRYACPEHGIIWCVATVRTSISYSSGIRKIFQRKDRFDYIWPEFKHIGSVPIMKKEKLMADVYTYPAIATDVWGYTDYGQEMREGYNFNNGLFRANASGSLAYLTYQEVDQYPQGALPTLSSGWIEQDPGIYSNTLVDQSGPQFYGLFKLVCHDVIPLDPDSEPMFMDHF